MKKYEYKRNNKKQKNLVTRLSTGEPVVCAYCHNFSDESAMKHDTDERHEDGRGHDSS